MSSIVALLLMACTGTTETPPVEPEPAPAPAPEPPPAPPPAPAEPQEKTVDAINAEQAALTGQTVKVKGYYTALTKVAEPPSIQVPLFADAEGKTASVVCVVNDVTKEPEIAAWASGTEVTLTGTVSAEKVGNAVRLDNCELPAPEGGTEGKEGKMGKEGKQGKEGGEGKAKMKAKAKEH